MNRENSDHLQERKEKISGEIVRDFDGKYYANLRKDATVVLGLPEYEIIRHCEEPPNTAV